MDRRGPGRRVVALFVGALVGNVAAEGLRLLFRGVGLAEGAVEKVLISPLVPYEFAPARLNLLALVVTFGLSLNFSLFTLLGMGLAWYYQKHSY